MCLQAVKVLYLLFNIKIRNVNNNNQRIFNESIWFYFVTEQHNISVEINVSMITNTAIFPKSVDKTVSKTDQMLLLFIQIFGGIDIVLLSVYLLVCIYDRSEREKKVDQFSHGNSTLYENVFLSASENN